MKIKPRTALILAAVVAFLLALVTAARAQSPSLHFERAKTKGVYTVAKNDTLFLVYVAGEAGTPLMWLRGDGRIWLADGIARICNVRRVKRNLHAAAAGSRRAIGYLNQCAIRYNKQHGVYVSSLVL